MGGHILRAIHRIHSSFWKAYFSMRFLRFLFKQSLTLIVHLEKCPKLIPTLLNFR
jgi:hypothetical protein